MPGTTNCRYYAIEQMTKRREQKIIETLATKVMGWGRGIRFRSDEDEVGDYVWAIPETGEVMALEHKWNPLRNISDAWMLVEKLREQCIFVDIYPTADSYNVSYDFGREVVNAPTASEAISMAAYKLVA